MTYRHDMDPHQVADHSHYSKEPNFHRYFMSAIKQYKQITAHLQNEEITADTCIYRVAQ